MLELFREVDLEPLYWSKTCVDMLSVELKLTEKACIAWAESLGKKPKLRTYMTFKNSFGVENYVRCNHSRQNRSLMAQIRLGILPLNEETGRYTNVLLQDRRCVHCPESIEDESHFILHCTLYKVKRQNLFIKAAERCRHL